MKEKKEKNDFEAIPPSRSLFDMFFDFLFFFFSDFFDCYCTAPPILLVLHLTRQALEGKDDGKAQ